MKKILLIPILVISFLLISSFFPLYQNYAQEECADPDNAVACNILDCTTAEINCAPEYRLPDECVNIDNPESECCYKLAILGIDGKSYCPGESALCYDGYYSCVPKDVPPEIPPTCAETFYEGDWLCSDGNKTACDAYDGRWVGDGDGCLMEDGGTGTCCIEDIPRSECVAKGEEYGAETYCHQGTECDWPDILKEDWECPDGYICCNDEVAVLCPGYCAYDCGDDNLYQVVTVCANPDNPDGPLCCYKECVNQGGACTTDSECCDYEDGSSYCYGGYCTKKIIFPVIFESSPPDVFCVGNDPNNRTTTPPSNPEDVKIATAIGCIPVGSKQLFVMFLLSWGMGIAGGIALILIVVAGIMFLTSGGDPKRMQAAKELLAAAVSGLLLLIYGAFILELIGVRILNIPGFGA